MEAEEYERMYRLEDSYWWYVGLRSLVQSAVAQSVKTPAFILDAGCGTGGMMRVLQPLGSVSGVDCAAAALHFCRERKIERVARATVQSLPFPDSSFDVVVSTDVLYHQMVEDERKALSEFRRVLRRNGLLVLNLPAYEFLRGSHDVAVHTRSRYTRAGLRQTVSAAGFRVERLSYRNSLLFPFVVLQRLLKKGGGSRNSDLQEMPQPVNSLLTGVLALENRLLAHINLPWGSSVFCLARRL